MPLFRPLCSNDALAMWDPPLRLGQPVWPDYGVAATLGLWGLLAILPKYLGAFHLLSHDYAVHWQIDKLKGRTGELVGGHGAVLQLHSLPLESPWQCSKGTICMAPAIKPRLLNVVILTLHWQNYIRLSIPE